VKKILLWSDSGINPLPFVSKGNLGNKVFWHALMQYLTKEEIHYDLKPKDMTIDEINHNYDKILVIQANIFGRHVMNRLEGWAITYSKIKIPIYMIGIGAQALNYHDLHALCSDIKRPATRLIKTVYDTGGEFALRGYFTKELFDRLGFKSAVVTGCPSFYQMGRNLQISNNKVKRKDFKPLINGYTGFLRDTKTTRFFQTYNNSLYMDQDQFFEILYDSEFEKHHSLNKKNIKQLIRKYSFTGIDLLCSGRIKLFWDIPTWFKFLREGGFNFSFGQRIHGNIAAMLNGIPAVVHCFDSRTRELAEFFDIPMIHSLSKKKDLYDLYLDADYTNFNKTFQAKFDNFENFLVKHGISSNIDDASAFKNLEKDKEYTEPVIVNHEYISKLGKLLITPKMKKILVFEKLIDRLKALIPSPLKDYFRIRIIPLLRNRKYI
jgi:hypothetical protein